MRTLVHFSIPFFVFNKIIIIIIILKFYCLVILLKIHLIYSFENPFNVT